VHIEVPPHVVGLPSGSISGSDTASVRLRCSK
jgi:hypothetical protein